MVCTERGRDGTVPGCEGVGMRYMTKYCYEPASEDTLVLVDEQQQPVEGLKRCQGACTTDSDCEGELKCWQRDGGEAIPGCSGAGVEDTNYCYDPEDELPELVYFGDDVPRNSSILLPCQGPCVTDWDCAWGANCLERTSDESVPGCRGDAVDGANYCYTPADGVLVIQ